jgi:hypothetical protein
VQEEQQERIVPSTLSVTGLGVLRFSDGNTANVDASLSVTRSFLSTRGGGEFVADGATATRALTSGQPLSLAVGEAANAEIVVYAARMSEDTARCRFRVQS